MDANFNLPNTHQYGSHDGDFWSVSTAPLAFKFSTISSPSNKQNREDENVERLCEKNREFCLSPRVWFWTFNFLKPDGGVQRPYLVLSYPRSPNFGQNFGHHTVTRISREQCARALCAASGRSAVRRAAQRSATACCAPPRGAPRRKNGKHLNYE